MYIAKQKINGKDYFYARESVRKGSKVMSKYIAYLSSNARTPEFREFMR